MSGPTPRDRLTLDQMRRRLEALRAYEESSRIADEARAQIARMQAAENRPPWMIRIPPSVDVNAEWERVLASGWLVTRCAADSRWLEARRGDGTRVLRATTFAGLCMAIINQGDRYGDRSGSGRGVR